MVLEESQLYRDLIRLKPDGWTANAWAVRAGVSRTVWTDMRRHGNPSRRTLEKLLTAAGSSLAEFEALRIGDTTSNHAPGSGVGEPSRAWQPGTLPALPLIESSPGGSFRTGEAEVDLTELGKATILDRLPRPASLAGDWGAYAFAIVSKAMWPRFRPKRFVAVSPQSLIEPGDDVLVILSSSSEGHTSVLIAELVECTGSTLLLRHHNPAIVFRIDCFQSLEKIVGELI